MRPVLTLPTAHTAVLLPCAEAGAGAPQNMGSRGTVAACGNAATLTALACVYPMNAEAGAGAPQD